MQQSNKEIINKFIVAYNSYDIDSMMKLLHPAILFKNISSGKVNIQTEGKEEFAKLVRQSSKIFKDREQKIVYYEEVNNKVNVEIQYRAKVEINLPNGLKSSDNINMRGKSEYTIKDGLIYSVVDKS